MIEGWSGDDYLVLFEETEVKSLSDGYGLDAMLPGYHIVGLRSWDDFIVQGPSGDIFTVPTLPCNREYLARFQIPPTHQLIPDKRLTGKVKWYIKPIAFGGDPTASDNITWVNHAEHAALVRWWNENYRAATDSTLQRRPWSCSDIP